MNLIELAQLISVSLEDDVHIDTAPKFKKDFATLECEDDEGNTFSIKVTKLNASLEDAEDSVVYDASAEEELEEVEL